MGMAHPNDKAFYVLRKTPHGVGGQVVLHVTDIFKAGYVCFDDTNRGHMIKGEIIEQNDRTFTFMDKNQDLWIFEIVTIELFCEEVYRYVCGGVEIMKFCNTTEDLWEYYRKEFPL